MRLPFKKLHKKQLLPGVFAVLFGAAAVVYLAGSFAATPTAFLEVENGSRSGSAAVVSDTSASGNGAVKFATPGSGGNCTPVPNIPAGFPNNCTTGYKAAPDYPGSLTNFSGTIQSGQTYKFKRFSGGTSVGSRNTPVSNVTFYGCLFEATGDLNVALFGNNITFEYSTFAPTGERAPPISYNQGYQYGIEANGGYYSNVQRLTVSNSEFWGFANAIDVGGSNQANPHVYRGNYLHDARADGGVDHTDGIGELNGGSQSYVVIDNNTIIGNGNTNGIAYQSGPADHFTVTNNYLSGYGYMINIGGGNGPKNITFTDNVWGTNFQQAYGPWYSWSGTGNIWRNNKIHYVNPIRIQGDNANSYVFKPSDDGKFWTPNGISSTDYQ